MIPTLFEKGLHRSTDGGSEEKFSRVGIIKIDGTRRRLCVCDERGLALKVASMLGVVSVMVTNLISFLHVATPAKILLDGATQSKHEGQRKKLVKEANGFIIASQLHCSATDLCRLSTILYS